MLSIRKYSYSHKPLDNLEHTSHLCTWNCHCNKAISSLIWNLFCFREIHNLHIKLEPWHQIAWRKEKENAVLVESFLQASVKSNFVKYFGCLIFKSLLAHELEQSCECQLTHWEVIGNWPDRRMSAGAWQSELQSGGELFFCKVRTKLLPSPKEQGLRRGPFFEEDTNLGGRERGRSLKVSQKNFKSQLSVGSQMRITLGWGPPCQERRSCVP